MKKLIVLSIILFFSLSSAKSQTSQLGFKAGYGHSWPDYDLLLPEGANTEVDAFSFSLLAYRKINNQWAIGIEPGYERRGAACIPNWQPVFEGDTQLHLNYVHLPLKLSYQINLWNENISLKPSIGYGISYLVSGFTKEISTRGGEGNGENIPISFTPKLSDPFFNRTDHGIYSSLSFAKEFIMGEIFIGVEYYYGMRNVQRNIRSRLNVANIQLGSSYNL